jgi:hypothetical protein
MVHHIVRPACRSLCFKGELSGLFSVVRWRTACGALVCRASQRGISIWPSTFSFVCGAAVSDVFPFWALPGFYFLQNGPYVLVVQFSSQGRWILSGCCYSRNSLYLFDVCPRLDFVAVGTLFLAWSSREGIGIVMFSALTVLGSEVVLL